MKFLALSCILASLAVFGIQINSEESQSALKTEEVSQLIDSLFKDAKPLNYKIPTLDVNLLETQENPNAKPEATHESCVGKGCKSGLRRNPSEVSLSVKYVISAGCALAVFGVVYWLAQAFEASKYLGFRVL